MKILPRDLYTAAKTDSVIMPSILRPSSVLNDRLGVFSKNSVPAYHGGVSGDNTLFGAFDGLDNNFSGVEQVLID